jgi:hypothetical protein
MSGLILHCGSQYVGREEIARVPTPASTPTWHPVPHYEIIKMVSNAVESRGWNIADEQYGLARSGQKLFGVMRLGHSGNKEWSRAIGLRNSHDQTIAVGLAAGLNCCVCDNLAFGGTTVIKRRHTSGIDLMGLVAGALDSLMNEFYILEEAANVLKLYDVTPDNARIAAVQAAEQGAIPSCDIVEVLNEFRHPRHEEFSSPNRWSFLNAFTEVSKKYSPARADVCQRKLTRLFGLDGLPALLWDGKPIDA